MAVKSRGQGFSMQRSYRYYYRRNLTGNWFAEIWSVPKSGLISAALAIPFVDIARDVMRGSTFVKTDYFSIGQQMELQGHEGLMLLVSGLLLVACFLPRAILGRGAHFAAISMIQPGGVGGYGCAQVINWGAAMAGLSYLWLAAGQSWEVDAVVRFATTEVLSVAENIVAIYAQSGIRILVIPLVAAVGATFGMAWTIIPAAAFWYVSLRFMSARKAKAKLETLPFNSLQAAMYIGSDFERLAELRAPQITLGYLIYCGALVGFVLYPISNALGSLM
ncbi:hypothetical protein VQ574_21430 (plasmid) [Stutzerimonas frequens]|uniref:hypothetical protein n=1 Tax=Stutzerimonas frequens TaxID=2968969 RepID=UPI002DBFF3C7|nr:hypothetical protein [Stutzerimonas frequens]WRW29289.1 hypothetical protein VQ574_21430 [Stutzerimonas frequens]